MKKVELGIRILLGLMMVVFGLNKFLHFVPMPPPSEEMINAFGVLMAMGIMPLVAIIEIVGGLLLLSNKQVPITLIVLFPIALAAVMFHAAFDVQGIGGAIGFALFTVGSIAFNKEKYLPMTK
jgi:uncharacterized membrane protein YphA (DoxX/SURF4 family)